MSAKFSVGSKVKHPECTENGVVHPAGTGTVETVTEINGQFVYRVKCDHSGNVLSTNFKESELSPQ